MAIRSKRIIKTTVSKTGITVDSCHCRKCRLDKPPKDFYAATDVFLDTNGFFSVCKDCCDDLYNRIYENEHSVDRTILKMCRILNVCYGETAMQALHSHIRTVEEKGGQPNGIFGIYKTKLMSTQKMRMGNRDLDIDLTFVEPAHEVIEAIRDAGLDDQEYFEESWGKGLNEEEYQFLETEFAKWKRTTKCDTQGEEILVRELCHKQNEIRKSRVEGRSVDGLVKSLQEIMKNSALTPALQSVASAGKSAETFGVWNKEIEQLTPSEWFDQQEKYRDMDGLAQDMEDIKRSIGNFITGSRDFNTTDLEEINEADDTLPTAAELEDGE
jgi:hypothetical protein